MNSLCPKLYHACSNSFNSSNVGNFFWSWILKTVSKFRKRKGKLLSHVFTSSTKREIRHFHWCCSRAATAAQKCTKKHDARAKLLLNQSKPIAFFPFSFPSPSSLLKLPIINFYYHRNHHHHTTIRYPCASRCHHYKDPNIGGLRRRRKRCLKSDVAIF